MKMTADTNVLVRAITGDDKRQGKIAQAELANADVVALAIPALCELVWGTVAGLQSPIGRNRGRDPTVVEKRECYWEPAGGDLNHSFG